MLNYTFTHKRRGQKKSRDNSDRKIVLSAQWSGVRRLFNLNTKNPNQPGYTLQCTQASSGYAHIGNIPRSQLCGLDKTLARIREPVNIVKPESAV